MRTIQPEALVPDPSLSLAGGAVEFLKGKETSWLYVQIEALAGALEFAMDAPFSELDPVAREVLFQGMDPATRARLKDHPHYNAFLRDWEGLVPELVRRHRETRSESVRISLEKMMIAQECPACRGHRLRAEALNVKIGERHIGEAAALTLEEFSEWIEGLEFTGEREILVGTPILD